jgi:prevent-host-death family protein
MARLSATEVARNFSNVLDRVAAGEEIEVVRNGSPVAVITPPRARLVSAERLRELMASAPPVDERFAEDLRSIRREAGPAPGDPWRS